MTYFLEVGPEEGGTLNLAFSIVVSLLKIFYVFRYVQKFTEERVKTEKFVVTVHAVKQRRSRLRSRKWATEFYKFLKDR